MRDIYERTFSFACRIVRLHRVLSRRAANRTLASQILRSGTSIGANLEEANGASSRADFIAKTRIALKEARETHYWLRVLRGSAVVAEASIQPLETEANEIVAILTAIVKNTTTRPKPHS
jgi:four helix bundle protein